MPFRPEAERHRLTPAHTAYLRVAEGCNHACTFCAIPSWRGRFRSKPWDAVLAEAAALVASGVKELCLIAEDTNQCACLHVAGLLWAGAPHACYQTGVAPGHLALC